MHTTEKTPRITEPKVANEQLYSKLAERGILEAARAAGWKPFVYKKHNANGWLYPVFDLKTGQVVKGDKSRKPAVRWKNGDKARQGGPKYAWPFGKQGCPPYYALPGTRAAITSAKGVAFMAAGEVDVLTYHSAGIRNVLSLLDGEGSIPKNLAETLTSDDVTDLYYFVDRDEAGERSGQRLIAALAGTPIRVHVYRLPEKLGDKGDMNDLWQHVSFDPVRYKAELQAIMDDPGAQIMPELNGNSEAQQRMAHGSAGSATKMSGNRDLVNWDVERSRWIKEAVMPNLDAAAPVKRGSGAGGVRQCPNPHHRDEHPSFRISYDRDHDVGVPQCSCDIQHQPKPWDIVASWVGAPSFKEWFKEQQKQSTHPPRRGKAKKQSATAPASRESAIEAGTATDEFSVEDNDQLTLVSGWPEAKEVPTDDEVGDMLIARMNGQYRYFYGRWNRYEGGVWLAEDNINRLVWDTMKAAKASGYKPKKSNNASILEYVSANLKVPDSLVDQGRRYINLRNGMIDLDTFSLVEHNPELYLTTQLGFDYDPYAICPSWHRYLATSVRNDDGGINTPLVALLQEAMGYSLTAETYLEKIFWLKGRPGSGKSTLLKVLRALVGDAGITLDLNTVGTTDSYQLASLGGKRVATCSEAKIGTAIPHHFLQVAGSGEEARVREIREKSQVIRITAKFWWAMNHAPQNPDDSGAMERRLIILPFDSIVTAEEKNPRLFDDLLLELPGILNWALEGWQRLRQTNTFTEVAQSTRELHEFGRMTNPYAAFLRDSDWCEVSATHRTQARDLANAYNAYAELHDLPRETEARLGREWAKLGVFKKKSGPEHYYVRLTPRAEAAVAKLRK